MKQAMTRFINKIIGRPMHKDLAVKINESNTVYVEPEKEFKIRHLRNPIRIKDLQHVSGQARVAARYFRRLEANQRMNGRRSLYPAKG